jgi:hypothetical protein
MSHFYPEFYFKEGDKLLRPLGAPMRSSLHEDRAMHLGVLLEFYSRALICC